MHQAVLQGRGFWKCICEKPPELDFLLVEVPVHSQFQKAATYTIQIPPKMPDIATNLASLS